MRPRTKLSLTLAMCVAAGTIASQRPVHAGNLSVSPVLYFSVDVPVGFRLSYAGSASNGTVLIDDLTYTASIDPCGAAGRCAYFPRGVMADFYTPEEGGRNPDADNIAPFLVYTYTEARGTDPYMALVEVDPTGTLEFDRMSHSTFAELHALSTRSSGAAGFTDGGMSCDIQTGICTPNPPIPNDPDPDNLLHWNLEGIAMSGWATPTSQARHYQTPQIIQPGNWVEVQGPPFVVGGYKQATVKIKGRVIPDLADAPVEVSMQMVVETIQ